MTEFVAFLVAGMIAAVMGFALGILFMLWIAKYGLDNGHLKLRDEETGEWIP